jgi:hypothetical protein
MAARSTEYSDILGAHSGAAKDSSLLRCDANSYRCFERFFCFHLQDQAMTPTASRDLKIEILEKCPLLQRRRDSEAI